MVPIALDRAAALIVELAGGKAAKGAIDAYPVRIREREVAITRSRTNAILGLELEMDEIAGMLAAIGLKVASGSTPDSLRIGIPTFRPDLEREIDLIEEVARLNGYDNIPLTMPSG